jgi:hypothetical protein
MRISYLSPTAGRALLVGALGIFLTSASQAGTVWNGPTTNFTQNVSGPSDFLTATAIITRGGNGPIYNSVYETFLTKSKAISPTNIDWATGTLANTNLTYQPFIAWANSPFDTAAGILNVQAVCRIKSEDIFFSVKFTAWGRFGAGGFADTRSTPSAVAPAPTVSITNPPSGTVYAAPANVKIAATASVSSGSVTNVSFFRSGTLIGSSTASPYSVTANSLAAGSYNLSAVATAAGVSATSSVVTVTIVNPVAVTMTNPVISNGQVSFNYSADRGLRYSVQSTSDFVNWNLGPTNAAAVNSVPFTQAVVPNYRFYRVARQPNP